MRSGEKNVKETRKITTSVLEKKRMAPTNDRWGE
jgi:hypothetical protein